MDSVLCRTVNRVDNRWESPLYPDPLVSRPFGVVGEPEGSPITESPIGDSHPMEILGEGLLRATQLRKPHPRADRILSPI